MSDEAWAYHMNGLVALIELRGDTPFRTNLGVRIFGIARRQIVCPSSLADVFKSNVIRWQTVFIDASGFRK